MTNERRAEIQKMIDNPWGMGDPDITSKGHFVNACEDLMEEVLRLRAERDAARVKLNELNLAAGLTNGSTPPEQYRLAAVATAKRNMELEALLRQHHEAQSALGVDSESGTDLGEAYTYSDLCDRTMAALGLQAQPESEESCPGQQ